VSENCKPDTEYVGVIAEADPVYVDDLFAAVKDMASAFAGVIETGFPETAAVAAK
jgi:hypothetical protein